MDRLNDLERAVLDLLLAGEDSVLKILREQYSECSVLSREYTGVGFFTYMSVPLHVPRVPIKPALTIGDVSAEIAGLEHGAGFLLFVKDGALDVLEAYTFDEPWPEAYSSYTLSYVPGGKRDLEALRKRWQC